MNKVQGLQETEESKTEAKSEPQELKSLRENSTF
jgi:hypothetical protein